MAQITISLNATELDLLREKTAKKFLSVTPELMALCVRHTLLEMWDVEDQGLLSLLVDQILKDSPITEIDFSQTITKKTPKEASPAPAPHQTVTPAQEIAAQARQDMRKQKAEAAGGLKMPSKLRAGQVTGSYKIWSWVINTMLNDTGWKNFGLDAAAQGARMTSKEVYSALSSMPAGWFVVSGKIPKITSNGRKIEVQIYTLTQAGRAFIMQNQEQLRIDGVWTPKEQYPVDERDLVTER